MSIVPRLIEDGGVVEGETPAEASVRMSNWYVTLACRKAELEAALDDDELSSTPKYASLERRLRLLRQEMDAHLDETLASQNPRIAFETIFASQHTESMVYSRRATASSTPARL